MFGPNKQYLLTIIWVKFYYMQEFNQEVLFLTKIIKAQGSGVTAKKVPISSMETTKLPLFKFLDYCKYYSSF